MNYDMFLKAHKKYGTTKEDIINKNSYDLISENVVIAPWWKADMFENKEGVTITELTDKLYHVENGKMNFTFIKLRRMGAPMMLEECLSLGVSKCKNLIFIGSVGSLDKNIKIGDLVIPTYSICGDGACRYLNDNLEDEFGKKQIPTPKITDRLIKITKEECKKANIEFHNVPNFSSDTMFAQFPYIDDIKSRGCQTIEMETAVLFKCAEITKINATALFCVSDNTVMDKSLFSGRSYEENAHRYDVRFNVMPRILFKMVEELQKDK